MRERLAALVKQVSVAGDRRHGLDADLRRRLDDVLSVLRDEHAEPGPSSVPATSSPQLTSCAVVTTGSSAAASVATCSGSAFVALRPSASRSTNVRVTV